LVYVGPHTARKTQVGRRLASLEPKLPTLNPKRKAGVTRSHTHTRPEPKAGVTRQESHTHASADQGAQATWLQMVGARDSQ
jgi:hypothetical protein